ncbi:galactose-3-O-sulfotransferase 2-like [Ylistrum balloti]|uniref:galactose-3-O-sulfotransferase 2-like n=1 Tax=Ylistrum balloti TaxID=509963 RepID=UPI0029057FB6|nr:galactose-3-O-sulfotransferase 2-like [Ylistrum balloti]
MKQKDFPAHHVTFLKVHKAASTSVQNIFYRYGYRYNLTFAQPKLGSGLGPTTLVTPDKFYPPPPGQTRFDIMSVHSSYNRTIFEKLVWNDSIYIAIVRQPFQQFASSIVYFNKKEVLSIPGTNPVRTLLSEKLYKSRLMLPSYRYVNGQSRDFGYPVKLLMSKYDKNKFQNFLQQLNTELDLVMLVERFDESMILLRRLLKWEMKDVISGKLNSRDVPSRFQFGATEENLYKEISKYDYALYDFFKKKFQAKIDQQPTDFHDELIYFIQTKEKYNKFCLSMKSLQYKVFRVLSFEESP